MANFAIGLGINLGVSLLTNLLSPPIEGPRLNDLNAPKSAFGAVIPKVWGSVRVGGNVIAASDIIERKSGGKGVFGPKTNQYTYYGSFATLLCEGPILAIKKIWLNGKVYYNKDAAADAKTLTDSNQFLSRYLRIYTGQRDQQTDSLLETIDDDLNAYRQRCYLVFEGLPLADFGNTFPVVSAEVVTAGTLNNGLITSAKVPLSIIIGDLCQLAGLTTDQYSTSDIEAITSTGFYTGDSGGTYRAYVDMLQSAYLIDAIETNGILKFQPAKRPGVAASIQRAEMAAFEVGTSKPTYIKETRTQELELPQSVNFKALNPALNYSEDSRKARRYTDVANRNIKQYSFSGVMNATEITTIAYKHLYLAWTERSSYKFFLPPKYLYLEAGDILEIFPETRPKLVKITKLNLGSSLLVEIEAKAYEASIYDFVAKVLPEFTERVTDSDGNNQYQLSRHQLESILSVKNESGTITYGPEDWAADLATGKITRNASGAIAAKQPLKVTYETDELERPIPVDLSGSSTLRVLDINLVKDNDVPYGLYIAVAANSNRWQPTTLHYSLDGGVSYRIAKTFLTPSILGICKTVLSGSPSASVRVEIQSGSLSSVPENWQSLDWQTALIGQEMIRFKSVNKITATTYEIYNLQRGVRGTEWAINAHLDAEEFTLLSEGIFRLEGTAYDRGNTLYFKTTSGGLLYESLDAVNSVSLTVAGNSLKPYGPVNVTGTRDINGNLTLNWQRRDRLRGDALTYLNLPLSEQFERYEVHIMDGSSIKRSFVNLPTLTCLYTVAQQIEDFAVVQPTVQLEIFQLSAEVGLGYAAQVIL
jgi:hypothetical protein